MLFLILPLTLIAIFLFLISPGAHCRSLSRLGETCFAHRGLHGNSHPENSLSAFSCAVENGYGIELDVQLSKDGVAMVFHDRTLKRVCGVSRRLESLTFDELSELRLFGTGERIPTLSEVLELVGGKVPLVVELKNTLRCSKLSRTVAELLDRYEGVYCIESFDPLILRWFRIHRPDVLRGQLASTFRSKANKNLCPFVLHHLLFNFLSRPDFIAYDERFCHTPVLKLCTSGFLSFTAVPVLWTVNSQERMNSLRGAFKYFIFEGFHAKR